jgi:hypothetical protein
MESLAIFCAWPPRPAASLYSRASAFSPPFLLEVFRTLGTLHCWSSSRCLAFRVFRSCSFFFFLYGLFPYEYIIAYSLRVCNSRIK